MESIEKIGFANGATARLSEINLNEITTENTYHMEEYYNVNKFNPHQYRKRIKTRLTMEDFIIQEDLTDFEWNRQS